MPDSNFTESYPLIIILILLHALSTSFPGTRFHSMFFVWTISRVASGCRNGAGLIVGARQKVCRISTAERYLA